MNYPIILALNLTKNPRKGRKWGFRRAKAHKNPDFVLERAENVGFEGKKRTKMPILCSKHPKTAVPDPKSAQKHRFCGFFVKFSAKIIG